MRKTGPRQLGLVFADSPSGGGKTDAIGRIRAGEAFCCTQARRKKTNGPGTCVADTRRLLEAVASEANLAEALLNVVRNKGAPGVDGQTVETAEAKAPSIIAGLRRDLLAERYRPGDVRRVWLPKPGGGQRGLGIPNVVDRAVQQAVLQILEPIFDATFHPSSHGFRPNRGAHTAIAEAKGYLVAGYQTVVDLDLAKFFDRVHHQRLLARIALRVTDQRIITLVRRMLTASVVMPDGTRVAVREGTPQGGPLSPILSNIVLDELDQELARRGLHFVRYADDANIFVRSERAGQRVMTSIRGFSGEAHAAPDQRGEEWRPQTGRGAFPRVPLSLPKEGRRRRRRHLPFGEGGTTTEDDPTGHDTAELGSVDCLVYGQPQQVHDRVDDPLSALYLGSGARIGGHRCPYPTPRQGNHRSTKEATTLPLPTSKSQRREPLRRRWLRVLREGSMGKI